MAVFTLRTLAPRGVAVVRDGHNVGLRLGVESQPASQTPEVRINPRQPRNPERGVMPAQRPDDHAEYDRMAATAAAGTGRSLRCDGVLSGRGAARIARPGHPVGMVQAAIGSAEILGRKTSVRQGQAQRGRERGGPGASVTAERLSLDWMRVYNPHRRGPGMLGGKAGLAGASRLDAFGFDVGVVN